MTELTDRQLAICKRDGLTAEQIDCISSYCKPVGNLKPLRRPRQELLVRCAVPESDPFDVKSYVYAIRRPDTREIKIGMSSDPLQRFRQLQDAHGAPLELLVVIPGAHQGERVLHHQF